MKETTKREMRYPSMGNRSRNNIGIARNFTPEWFNDRSSYGLGKSPQPVIKPFNKIERRQLELRRRLQKETKLPPREVLKLWEDLVKHVTKKITRVFNDMSDDPNQYISVSLTRSNLEAAKQARDLGIGQIERLVNEQINKMSQSFMFISNDELFYLRRPRLQSTPLKHKIKIGKTTEQSRRGRDSAYNTSSGGDVETVYCVKVCYYLNESNVLSWLSSKGLRPVSGREWFEVSPELLEILKCPAILREELKHWLEQ
jgi:hypothetical protein